MLNTLFIREERSVAEPMSDSPFGPILPVLAYVDENTSSRLRATTYLAGLSRTARALKCALPHSFFAFSWRCCMI